MIKRFIHNHDRPVKPMNKTQRIYRDKVVQKFKNNEYQLEKVSTCICGNTKFDLFSKRERYGLYMQTVICTACGIIIQSPRLSHNSLVDFYKNYYRPFYMETSSPKLLFKLQINKGNEVLSYLSHHRILLPTNARVLDAGCGPGGALQPFIDKGYECLGCDFTNQQVQYGKSRGLNLFLGGIKELCQKQSNYFDFVMLNDVLEHLLDPGALLDDIRKILKTDGIIYVQFPGNRGIPNWLYPDMLRLLQLAHTYYFDLKQLQYLFLLSDYEMIAGNESLQGVFRKVSQERVSSRKKQLAKELQNYCGEVLEFISKCEKLRLLLFLKNNIKFLFKNPKHFLGQTSFFLRHSIFN